MEPHGVFREVTALCTKKDHYQSASQNGTQYCLSHEKVTGQMILQLELAPQTQAGEGGDSPIKHLTEVSRLRFWSALYESFRGIGLVD